MKSRHAHYDTYDSPSYWKGRDYEHESEVLALTAFTDLIKSLGNTVDVGGGFGRLIPHYQKKAKKVTLAEPSKALLDLARTHFKKHKHVGYLQATVAELPIHISKESLDTLIMVRVMHHLVNPQEVIEVFSKLLKKNGFLILEFANKIHGKALLENICKGDFTFPVDISPTDRRCVENQQNEVISFYNYHPDTILQALKEHHLKVVEMRSVSNIRSRRMKKVIPLKALMGLEALFQKPLASIYFGPSIFILAQKQEP